MRHHAQCTSRSKETPEFEPLLPCSARYMRRQLRENILTSEQEKRTRCEGQLK